MKDDDQDRRKAFGLGLPASVAVHVAVVLLLVFGLPISLPEPEEEKAVEVELVQPPEEEEQAEAEPPPPPPEQEEEEQPQAEPEPPSGDSPQPPASQPVLQPVFRFGENDAGPRIAPQGSAAQEAGRPRPQESQPEPPAAPETLSTEGQEADPAPAEPLAEQAQEPAEPSEAEQAEAEAAAEDAGPLASQAATGDIIATTAIEDVPRGVRAGRLCVTALREELRNAVPPYFPDLLPSFRLGEGNVLDVRRAAFRMGGEWFDLTYRCEVDPDATRVRAFAYRVGGRVPPGEWRQRGLPAN